MRRNLSLAALLAALLAGVHLLAPGTPPSPPPRPDPGRAALPDRGAGPPAPTPLRTPLGTAPGHEPGLGAPLDSASEPGEAADRARALLVTLRCVAESSDPEFPQALVEEAARLVASDARAEALFLEAVREGTPALRSLLAHVFFRVGDPEERERVVAAFRAAVPVADRIRDALADAGLAGAELLGNADAAFRRDLLARLPRSHLEDPDVGEALKRIAGTDPDPELRSLAILRLGRLDEPAVLALLVGILENPTRPETDRQAAANALSRSAAPQVTTAFVGAIERSAPPAVQRFAALGLGRASGDARAPAVLLALLEDEQADGQARMNAASSLARLLKKGEIDEERLLAPLRELSLRGSSREVVVAALASLVENCGARYVANVRSILDDCRSEELRRSVTEHPLLRLYMEAG